MDTRGFFRDADLVVGDYEERGEGIWMRQGSEAYDRATTSSPTTTLLNAVTLAFSSHSISTPLRPSPSFQDMDIDEINEDENETSMLQTWTRKEERHEKIAWWMERNPYMGREHLSLLDLGWRDKMTRRGSEKGVSKSEKGVKKSAVKKGSKREKRRGVRV